MITVPAPTLVSISLSPQGITMPLGTTQQFFATGIYSDGSSQDLTSTATWTSSSSPATVGGGRVVVLGFARLRLAASWADFSGVHLCRADEQVSEVSARVEIEVEVDMARRENCDRLRFGSGAVYDSTLTFWAAMVVMHIAASA
jgi:hypothetical protein